MRWPAALVLMPWVWGCTPSSARDAAEPDAASFDAATQDAAELDAADPDAWIGDAAIALDATPDAAPAQSVGGFTAAEIAIIAHLSDDTLPPPDPTNRYDADPAAARVGQALFFNRALSPLGRSCALCHSPDTAFSSALSYDGHGGLHFRHAPSLLNLPWLQWFFWDGRADTRWAQARTPIESPDELGSDRVFLTRAIAEDVELAAAYVATFGPLPPVDVAARFPARARPDDDPDSPLQRAWEAMAPGDRRAVDTVLANVGKALAAYQRRLISFDAPFDAFARAVRARDQAGLAALSAEAQRGLRLFIGEAGCVRCHAGPIFTDGAFHRVGLGVHPRIPLDAGRIEGVAQVLADPFNAAGVHSDTRDGWQARRLAALEVHDALRGQTRTPSLRNVSQTGGYLHDGRFNDLFDVVAFKVRLDVEPAQGPRDPLLQPRDLDAAQIADLVAFLMALEGGPTPAALIGRPAFEE